MTENGLQARRCAAYDAQVSLTIDDATLGVGLGEGRRGRHVIKAALGDPPMLYPEMAVELMGSDLFMYDANAVSVTYGTSVEGGAVTASSTGGTVTVMGVIAGDAKVTITATATPNASSLVQNQTKANVAQLTFSVTVDDPPTEPEPTTVTAKSPEDVQAHLDLNFGSDFTPGTTRGFGLGELFELFPEGADVVMAVESSNESIASVEGVSGHEGMLMAVAAGETTISVTATDRTSGDSDTASGTVAVTLANLTVTVTADPPAIDEGGTSMITATASRPVDASEGAVTINVSVAGEATLDAESITIAALATSGSVMLTSMKDADTEDDTLTVTYSGTGIEGQMDFTIAVTDLDMDPPEIAYALTASADMVAEGGPAVTITATATPAVSAATTIELVHGAGSASAGDYMLEPTMITIPADGTSGMAMLTADEDTEVEGDESLTVNGMMGNVIVDSVTLTITDNDMAPPPAEPTVRAKAGAAGMIAAAIATAAGGSDWMVGGMVATVDMSMLFDVDAGVTAAYSGGSSAGGVVRASSSGMTLNLTPMGAGSATITVTGSDAASSSVATVSHDAMVVLQTLSITVAASSTEVMEGGSVTLTATANRGVEAETKLSVTVVGDATVEGDAITIPAGMTVGTAMVMVSEDDDSADDEVSVVVSGAALSAPVTFNISVTDSDPTVTAKSADAVDVVFTMATVSAGGTGGWLPGGAAAEVDMSELFNTNGSPTLVYEVESSAPAMVAASASGSMLTLTPVATGSSTISVTATDSSGDAADTASVMSMVMVGVQPLEITVTPATAEVTEGGTVEITAMANKMVDANVEVMLMRDAASSAGEDDYSVSPMEMMTIMAGEMMAKATLTATDDYMVEDTETLTLVARVKDMGDVGMVMVTIMDNDMETTYTLSGPMDMNIVEGMSATS